MPNQPYNFTLCYTIGNAGSELLMVQRQLLQKWVGGRPVQGIIPAWAGQWGAVANQPLNAQPLEESSCAAFLAQTGVDLKDNASIQRYGILGTDCKNLQDSSYNPVPVLYVAMSPAGLKTLAADIGTNLTQFTIQDGVLQTVAITSLQQAKSLLGPAAAPPDGWRGYLVQNYYGGKAPGQLNTEIDQMTKQLSLSSSEAAPGFKVAIDNTPVSLPSPTPEPIETRLVELKVTGAERSPAGTWYQEYAPGQSIRIQAVTDPAISAAQSKIVWQGGMPDPSGYPALRCVPLDAITPQGTVLTVKATLEGASLSVNVAVVPKILRLDITDAYSAENERWELLAENKETPAVVKAVMEPESPESYRYLTWTGGTTDLKNPYDRRLVAFADFKDKRTDLQVEVDIKLD